MFRNKNPRWRASVLLVGFLVTLLGTSFSFLVTPHKASAYSYSNNGFTGNYTLTATFVNAGQISLVASGTVQWPIASGGYDKVDMSQLSGTYTDSSDPYGPYSGKVARGGATGAEDANPGAANGAKYWFNNNTSACTAGGGSTDIDVLSYAPGKITLRINPYLTPVSGSVDVGKCPSVQFGSNIGSTNTINVSDPSTGAGGTASQVVLDVAGGGIKSLDGANTFSLNQGSTTVYTISGSNSDGCTGDTITAPAKTSGNYFTATLNGHTGASCVPSKQSIVIAGSLNASATSSGGSSNSGGSNCNTTKDGTGNCTASNPDTLSCTSGSGFFTAVLNWILCGAINLAWGAANILDNWIMNTLDVDVSGIFDNTGNASSASHGYYVAWNSFRVIASALLVIGGLIMVTAQALGFEALDAYTVRKVLPRLLIAVIGISLSWPLMRLVVDFFDTAGLDIREIMYAPFNTPAMHGTVSAGVGILTTLTLTAGIFVMGPASLTFLLTAMLAAFVGFLILVIRQIAIVMLVILAPVAIACYILPNTQKIWKLWYDNFLGLMLMFPIISALIAAGHIFSAVTLKGGVGGGVVAQAIGLIAYFAPYFLLPMAARMATGVIGNIAGFVNDKHRGAFDRLKGVRQNATQRNLQNMKTGTRTNNAAINALTARATTPYLGMGRRGREAFADKMELATHDFAKSRHGMATQFKDPVLQAKTYASEAEARRRMKDDFGVEGAALEDAIAGAKVSGGFGGVQQVWAAKQLAATGTGYNDEAQMLATIARVAGNNEGLADSMWGEMRGTSERAGRNDLKAGYSDGTKVLRNIQEANKERGSAWSGAMLQADDRTGGFSDQLADFSFEAARGVDNMTAMGRNKPKSIGNMMRNMDQNRARYEAQLRTGQQVQRNARGEWVGTGRALSSGQAENAKVRLGQIHTKMENMKNYADYGPEVNAEYLHGARQTVPGSGPGDMRYSGERAPGYASDYAPAKAAADAVGERPAVVASAEELSKRALDPRAVAAEEERRRAE